MRLCTALTNIHVVFNPFRRKDLESFRNVRARLYHIGESRLRKRREKQRSYPLKRKTRIEASLRHTKHVVDGSSSTSRTKRRRSEISPSDSARQSDEGLLSLTDPQGQLQ